VRGNSANASGNRRVKSVNVSGTVRAKNIKGIASCANASVRTVIVKIGIAPATNVARIADRGTVGDVPRFIAFLAAAWVALLASSPVSAATDRAAAYFSEAKAAFEAQDYSRALALFERALEGGMDGPAIHYNIGVAAFRGGDLPRAERAFREAGRTPSMAALAHYNLGLVALDRRDEREARDWFRSSIERDAADGRLTALTSRRLEELPQARTNGAWSFYARGGAGHDDNIALRSETAAESATGAMDSFADLSLFANYSLGGWRFDAGGSTVRYTEQNDFSQTSLYLGASRRFRLDNWYFELSAQGSQLSFGGEVFERTTTGGAMAAWLFEGGGRLRAQARMGAVKGQGFFSGLTGDRTELGLYFDKPWRNWNFIAHTRAERNKSEDLIYATRWIQVGAEARYAMTPRWGFMLGTALRRTTRPAESAVLPGWKDKRLALQAGATRALWKQAQLAVRYEHEGNESPVAGFDYDRNRVSASMEFWY
jgi:tetratricopeptide (TPR) repeat protein